MDVEDGKCKYRVVGGEDRQQKQEIRKTVEKVSVKNCLMQRAAINEKKSQMRVGMYECEEE